MVTPVHSINGEVPADVSQLRQDPLTGRWVILAAGRRNRPNEFPLQRKGNVAASECPFCPGREGMTTPEILATGRPAGTAPDSPGWSLRVFPNLYPALRAEESEPPGGRRDSPRINPLFRSAAGTGAHEIIAYSPDHEANLGTMARSDVVALLEVMQKRYADLSGDPRHRYVLQFVNHGPEAGATLAHPHLQILATPFVPATVREKQARMADHAGRTGRCLVCDLLAAEEAAAERLVARDEHWTVVAPWASRFPWEMLLIPRRCHGSLLESDPEELDHLAGVLGDALRRLDAVHGDTPWNLVLHGAPLEESRGEGFHWHLELCPRLSRLAGFEAGTGFAINSIAPEEAAVQLREKEC